MKAVRRINVTRVDDGVFTHVKVNGRLYRKENVEKAVRSYIARISTRYSTSRPGAAPDGSGCIGHGSGETKEGE